MEAWTRIRRRVLVEGVSRRQVLRETGMHWRTLRKILEHSEPPGYRMGQRRPAASGSHGIKQFWRDALGGEFRCTVAGTPGTWMPIRPAAVTADPSSGTIPTGYLILNVTTGHIKRHAGGYVWEVPGA